MQAVPESNGLTRVALESGQLNLVADGCEPKPLDRKYVKPDPKEVISDVSSGDQARQLLNQKMANLEMELAAAKAAHGALVSGASWSNDLIAKISFFLSETKNTNTGEKRKKLEEEKGIVVRFVIGHSSIAGGILDKAADAENKRHGDILRLDHVEGYLELSAKTKTYFATAVSQWDADFYVKVDDDVHVNIATLGHTLVRHRKKPHVYIGCMKSGPVLAQKGVKYHEPEYWKFGEIGNRYFRHATGQLYAISKDLASYILINQHILHKFANEDVSLGSWFIGLDVEHIDDRRLCCGTPPDCEWKAHAGNLCVASFDWTCSGICRSIERMKEIHRRCGEGDDAIFKATF
ncbi:hypothetical protein Cgig2_007468 [Carnegiea gigantea]|uniref:Hexosyltransferase n=1 Tax=Carnegiea gigantea TaxID=171969 RepID=A0A9Q1QDH3_9CARY|nr:hypothetical protein Cgig2_007468 [Carnegiea gigantea]